MFCQTCQHGHSINRMFSAKCGHIAVSSARRFKNTKYEKWQQRYSSASSSRNKGWYCSLLESIFRTEPFRMYHANERFFNSSDGRQRARSCTRCVFCNASNETNSCHDTRLGPTAGVLKKTIYPSPNWRNKTEILHSGKNGSANLRVPLTQIH